MVLPIYFKLKKRKQLKQENKTEQRVLELNKQHLTQKVIAKRLNISGSSVSRWLNKNGITTRKEVNISREELYRLYVEEKKSTCDIALIFKCSSCTIIKKLQVYNIPTRSKEEGIKIATEQGKYTYRKQIEGMWNRWRNSNQSKT